LVIGTYTGQRPHPVPGLSTRALAVHIGGLELESRIGSINGCRQPSRQSRVWHRVA
jgi:hypothetical protein